MRIDDAIKQLIEIKKEYGNLRLDPDIECFVVNYVCKGSKEYGQVGVKR